MKQILFYSFASLALLCSCGEADMNDPYGSKIAPAQVTNVSVKDSYGESVVSYDKPDDRNLKYVKAVYMTDDSTEFDANASYYTDTILINGFGHAGAYRVDLYSVSYGEAYSGPVSVTVNPLTPPYLMAYDSLEINSTFGGISIQTSNRTGAKLSIGSYKKNEDGEWEEIGMTYTTARNIAFSVRGQESVETEFGVQVRDRWSHLSEIKTTVATPLYEIECDKSLFKSDPILTDTYEMHSWSGSNTKFEALWDGSILQGTSTCFHTKTTDPMPQHFTIDLGMEYQLSRFVVHGRASATAAGASSDVWTYVFASGHPKTFELWGSTNPDRETGAFDDTWFLVGTYTITRADGSTTTQAVSALTDEDKALIVAGSEFDVPDGTPKLRWIRFRTLNTYGNVNSVMLDELTFYGAEATGTE